MTDPSQTIPTYPNNINDGDTAWMLTSTALVYLMTPGVGFFYGGMVDHKNVINQLFLSICCMGLITVQWVLFGYSLAFQLRDNSPGLGGGNWVTSGFGLTSLGGKDVDPTYSPTYPQLVHVLYQGAFAVITAALISGGVVGRVKFWPYMLFLLIWTTCIYDPLAHWVWSADGWLGYNSNGGLGAIDFAGGTVVHISSGTSAITAAYVLGKRFGIDTHHAKPASAPFTMLGATFLWIGWNGFNAGSANSASGIAAVALVSTNACAAAASFTWICLDALLTGKPTLIGGSIGAVVGLVVITPAAGFVQPGWAILMGFIGAIIIWGLLRVKHFLRADDTLDVFISHGCGGMVGAFMTGLFAQTEVNPAGPNGAFYGNPIQLGYQCAGIATTVAFASTGTALILLLLKYTIGIRVPEEHETMGIDDAIHGESYFTLTIADITGANKGEPLNIQIRDSGSQDEHIDKKHPYAGESDSPVSEGEKRDHTTAMTRDAHEDPPAPRQMGSRNVSSSRTREAHAQIQGDNLSSAVAQLVSQLALPGHNYDIGISRSC